MNDILSSKEQVQRFSGWGIAIMQNKPVTEYVLASDYDVLLAESERLRAVLNSIANNSCCTPCQEAANVARVALGRPTLYIQPDETSCATHASEHRMRAELPCPWCVIDELKRNRDAAVAAKPTCGWGGAYGRCVLEPDHDGPHEIPRHPKTPAGQS